MTMPRAVLHWYDFVCPFCYVGQHRNAILSRAGLDVVPLPLQADPGIPPGGVPAGPRQGPAYTMVEQQARSAGLELHWPVKIPNSRRALAAAEWVRRHQPSAHHKVTAGLFDAHFVLGEDIGDPAVVNRHLALAYVDLGAVWAALEDGSAHAAVGEAEAAAHTHGVDRTPSWLIDDELIVGLQSTEAFQKVARDLRVTRGSPREQLCERKQCDATEGLRRHPHGYRRRDGAADTGRVRATGRVSDDDR